MNRALVTALVLVVAAAWIVTALLSGDDIGEIKLPPVSAAVTAVSLAIVFFDRFAWRVVATWLGRPVILGTWRGKLESNFQDPLTRQSSQPIDIVAVVTQTYSSVVFRLMTAESYSVTKPAAIVADEDGRATLAGVYINTPNVGVRARSEMHSGALRLLVEGEPARGLTGSYWTERNTVGEISLTFVSRTKVHTFAEGMKLTSLPSGLFAKLFSRHS